MYLKTCLLVLTLFLVFGCGRSENPTSDASVEGRPDPVYGECYLVCDGIESDDSSKFWKMGVGCADGYYCGAMLGMPFKLSPPLSCYQEHVGDRYNGYCFPNSTLPPEPTPTPIP